MGRRVPEVAVVSTYTHSAGPVAARRAAPACSLIERVMYSPANYWIMLWGDLAGAAVFLVLAARLFHGAGIIAMFAVVVGFASWGGVEYAAHRWILHGTPSVVQRAHALHHRDPAALTSAPLGLSTALAFGIWGALSVPLTPGTAALVVFGLYAGYNGYALLHHVQHHLPAVVRLVPGLSALEHAHRVHHKRYVVNYGVTTRWWDRALGSEEVMAMSARTNQPATPTAQADGSATRQSRGPVDAPGKRHRTPPPQEALQPRMGEPQGKRMGQKSTKAGFRGR